MDRVRALGADHVIDYTKEDFTSGTTRYGLIVDDVGNRSLTNYLRVLEPQGVVALVGASKGDWIGPFEAPMEAAVLDPFLKEKFLSMYAHINADDLAVLAGLIQSGKVKPVIDRHYTLSQAQVAMGYLEGGHAQGKVVIDVE
jgi:NADPH:quinone reductase-like Zn-dependent oxidoreductase